MIEAFVPGSPEVPGTPDIYDCWVSTIEVDATGEQNFADSQFLGIEDWSYSGDLWIDDFWGQPDFVKDDADKQNWIADNTKAWTNCKDEGNKIKCPSGKIDSAT